MNKLTEEPMQPGKISIENHEIFFTNESMGNEVKTVTTANGPNVESTVSYNQTQYSGKTPIQPP